MIDLLDASVWIPLSATDHVHHGRARAYWENEAAEKTAFCRVTVLALLRHLTNPQVMQAAVLSSEAAWAFLAEWRELPEVLFLPDPAGLDAHLEAFSRAHVLGPASWTDAYLAAFAIAGALRMVTFDRGFRRYAGLDLLLLEPKPG